MQYVLEDFKIGSIHFDNIADLNQYLYESYHPDSYNLLDVTTCCDRANNIERYIVGLAERM